ncbi:MAG: hexose kinase [Clostridia bacterium]|nr:hexose kinase [Clostridia bacterium]
MKITTLTLNPAFDIHVSLKTFPLGRESLADAVSRDIGGKGINISRALTENGIENTALVVLGKENSAEFLRGMERAGLTYQTLLWEGRIRENITIHPESEPETRLSFKGFEYNASLLKKAEELIDPQGIVTFTGSVPAGISAEEIEAFLLRLKEKGARLVIDSKSVSLEMLKRIQPWLIKPNAEEVEAYYGKAPSEEELYAAAMELHQAGIANAMISLGGSGAVLAAEGRLYRAQVPAIKAVSTVGAGDSAIAGFLSCDDAPEKRLRYAVAYGSAACLREGTNPPRAVDIDKIFEKVSIKKL